MSLKKAFSSVQFSLSVVFDSLRPHEPQHARPPCPLSTPRVHPNSCPLSRWCHPTISSSVIPFSSRLQSFQASGSFQMSQYFASGGQTIGVSASASVLPMNIQDGFPLVGSPCSPRDSWESSPTPQFKNINYSALSFLYSPTLTSMHDYWKNHSFDYVACLLIDIWHFSHSMSSDRVSLHIGIYPQSILIFKWFMHVNLDPLLESIPFLLQIKDCSISEIPS